MLRERNKSRVTLIDELEQEVIRRYQRIDELLKTDIQLIEKIRDLEDYKVLLYRAREVFYSKHEAIGSERERGNNVGLLTVAGIIQKNDIMRFNKMIFRSTKGNSLVYTFDVPNHDRGDAAKSVFIIMLESGGTILSKINRICDSFGAKKYPLPEFKDEYNEKMVDIDELLADTIQLKGITEKNLRDIYLEMTEKPEYSNVSMDCSRIEYFRLFFELELKTYINMNYLENQKMIMIAHLWIPKDYFGQLLKELPSFVNIRLKSTHRKQPTHFELNEFTAPFQ